MKKIYLFIVLFATLLITSFTADTYTEKKNKLILDLIKQALADYHYSVKSMDNNFSAEVYAMYLEKLDYNKRFFLQSDINQFAAYKYKIDDELKSNDLSFFYLTKDIYTKRVKEVETYIKKALKKNFDFNENDSILLDPEKKHFARDKKELKDYWRKSLKYSVMTKLADKIKLQEDAEKNKDTTVKIQSIKELQKKSVEEVKQNYEDWFHRVSKIEENDLLSLYLNSITGYYCPHSGYFPPKDKKNFDIRMSGKLEGIGAQLSQPNAYIKVAKIIPGSPCWKQGELEVGDKILKVAQGAEEPVDVVDMRLDKAIQFIRGKKGSEVRLTVKKTDGSIKVIPIIRDVVLLDETYAKSALISDSLSGNKVGYISLPSFYVDFSNKSGRRSSSDMKKEIQKLAKENIKGLILDLRNNGGGSLQDAIDIAGYFIKKGPIVQVRDRYGNVKTLKDNNSSILYPGNLVIMINEFSASASEITAAAIQDYGRGLVVGSKHSFGKGTVQRFLPFDRMVRGKDDLKPLGDLKISIQKFYRINGGSTQLKGVASDIVFPDAYQKLKMGEKDMDNPMPWDEIPKADYKKFAADLGINYLKAESNKRISSDTSFNIINNYADKMKYYRDMNYESLNLKKYMADAAERNALSKKYKNARERKSTLQFFIPHVDSATVYSDTVKAERIDSWLEDLNKDIYINETFNIINDMQGRN